MKIDNVSFPYPVLGINDDVTPTLDDMDRDSVVITIDESNQSSYTFNIELYFENEGIKDYIKKGKAEYVVDINCPSTLYRRCISSVENELSIIIPSVELHGKLTFQCFVVAKYAIDNYEIEGLNVDYEDHVIRLRKGDLMVAFPEYDYVLKADLRNMKNPASFMTIKSKDSIKFVEYSLGNKLTILVPPPMFEVYQRTAETSAKEELFSSLILGALTYALFHYMEHRNEEKLWVMAINARLKDPELSDSVSFQLDELFPEDAQDDYQPAPDDILELAQAMLRNPYNQLFNKIDNSQPNNHITI